MLYFDLGIYKEELLSDKEQKLPIFLKNMIYFFRKNFGRVLKLNIAEKTLIIIPKVNKRVLKKVDKILKVDVTKNVCLSNELLLKEEFVNFINSRNVKILDGKWLFKYLIKDIVEFICKSYGVSSEQQEISILTNESSIFIFESVKRLAEKVKNINIVTKDISIFKKLEKEVYEEKGLIIRVTNDFKRAVLKSSIVLNLDFIKDDFYKLRFNRASVIVNFEERMNVNQKGFEGVVCDFYHVSLPHRYLREVKRFNKFNSTILYESFIFKKTVVQNIWKEIEEDNILIDCLENKNGIIRLKSKVLENKKVKILNNT